MRKEELDAAQQCLKVIMVCTFLEHEPHDRRVILLLSLLHQGLLLRRNESTKFQKYFESKQSCTVQSEQNEVDPQKPETHRQGKLIPTPLQNINKNHQKEERIGA
jgi:hypothetical protein